MPLKNCIGVNYRFHLYFLDFKTIFFLSETSITIINCFQEIKNGPEFRLKEIKTGVTFFFCTNCIGNEKFP